MKNRKVLIGAAALLAAVAVALICGRETPGGEAASPSLVQGGDRPSVARRDAAFAGAVAAATNGTSRILTAGAPAVPTVQTPTKRGTKPYVLTVRTAFGKPLRLAVEALGAKTVSSVSRKSVLIEADAAALARIRSDARFEDVAEFAPAEKIQPALAALVEKGGEPVEVSIVALSEEDRASVIETLVKAGGEMLKGCINEGDTIRAKIPSDCVALLAGRGEVRWMETFVRPKFVNNLAVQEPCMNVIERVWTRTWWRLEHICGEGQSISTSDTGIDSGDPETLHPDLKNRVRDMQVVDGCYTNDVNGHGTHTAGSIVGDGTQSGGDFNSIRGTAWKADLYAWFCGGKDGSVQTPDTLAALFQNNGAWPAALHSASWGSPVSGQYISFCVDCDRYVWEHPEFLPVFAAGNEGCDDYGSLIYTMSISSPGSAKNVLTVGATQSTRTDHDGGWGNGDPTETVIFSSRGPCQDGRIKPDVAAPGVGILSTRSRGVDYSYGVENEYYAYDSGTSMATPLTAGAVALVREWLMKEKGFDGTTEVSPGVTNGLPTSALLKAIVMGGARGASVPNNDQGWGRVDLSETLYPTNGRAVKLFDRIPFRDGWVTNIVIETTNAAPLDVQLVWVDYPGSASGSQSTPRLVNDLDLSVQPYGTNEGDFYYGNGGDEPDTVNNAESVRIDAASPGKYIITVDCQSILHDYTEGGAAALYIRGAFDPEATPDAPKCVRLANSGEEFYSLNEALVAVQSGETVQVLRPTRLLKSVTVPADCSVVTAAAEPDVAPIVRCSKRASLTVPEDVSVTVTGVTFTNACAGLVAEGALSVSNTTYDTVSSVAVAEGGELAFAGVRFTGRAPAVAVASNGVARLKGVTVSGAAADWSAEGRLELEGSRFAEGQSLTVEPFGNLTLRGGVTNLSQVTLAAATKDSLFLAGAHEARLEISAPNAVTNGAVFGSYAGEAAAASASRLVNVLDEERELGGKAEGGLIRWAVVEAPPDAAGASVDAVGQPRRYYYGFKSAFRVATNGVSTLTLITDATYDRDVSLPYDLTLAATNGAQLVLNGAARFTVPEDVRLALTNITVSGDAEIADCAFRVKGGELTLEDGAVLSGFRDEYASKSYGGTIVVDPGHVTMKGGSRIENCAAQKRGGAIWLSGYRGSAVADLLGGTITGCSAELGGGAVYACSRARVNVAGDFTADDNAKGTDKFVARSNLSLSSDSAFALTGVLTGSVGVGFPQGASPNLNAEGAAFVDVSGVSSPLDVVASADRFLNDVNGALQGSFDEAETRIVWSVPEEGDYPASVAGVRVIFDGGATNHFRNLDLALAAIDRDATVETRGVYDGGDFTPDCIRQTAEIACRVRIRPWSDSGATTGEIWRAENAMCKVVPGGSLTLSNVCFYGLTEEERYEIESESTCGLISVQGGALTLESGSGVRLVYGMDSRRANAISVWDGGTFTMESGSYVVDGRNSCAGDATGEGSGPGEGGGVLLDGSTAYFKGGSIRSCSAYRAGGVFVGNGSTACVSGDFTAVANTDLANGTDNFVVSENSRLILDGELTGSVGVNEGIGGDSNKFASVTWAWTDTNTLAACARRFTHDKRAVPAVAATNGTETILVWEDAVRRDERGPCYTDGDGRRYAVVTLAPTGGLLPEITDPNKIQSELRKLADGTVAEKITTLEEYDDFRAWANGVEGGAEAVAASDKAYVSYEFGTTNLFENEPAAEIAIVAAADGSFTLTVVVRDGADEMAVASAKVAALFEGTTDVGDWTSAGKRLDLKADGVTTDLTEAIAKKVEFAIRPAGSPGTAFIRLKY